MHMANSDLTKLKGTLFGILRDAVDPITVLTVLSSAITVAQALAWVRARLPKKII